MAVDPVQVQLTDVRGPEMAASYRSVGDEEIELAEAEGVLRSSVRLGNFPCQIIQDQEVSLFHFEEDVGDSDSLVALRCKKSKVSGQCTI